MNHLFPSAISSNLLIMLGSLSSSHCLFAISILSFILSRVSFSISAKSLLISSILLLSSFISSSLRRYIQSFSVFNVSSLDSFSLIFSSFSFLFNSSLFILSVNSSYILLYYLVMSEIISLVLFSSSLSYFSNCNSLCLFSFSEAFDLSALSYSMISF